MWTHFLIHHTYMIVFFLQQSKYQGDVIEIYQHIDWLEELEGSPGISLLPYKFQWFHRSSDASSAWEWESNMSNWLRFTMKQFGNSSHNCSFIMNIRYWTCQIHHRKMIPMHFLNQYMQDSDKSFSLRWETNKKQHTNLRSKCCLSCHILHTKLGMVPNHPKKTHYHSFLFLFNETKHS